MGLNDIKYEHSKRNGSPPYTGRLLRKSPE
jgi:hypothetical protein